MLFFELRYENICVCKWNTDYGTQIVPIAYGTQIAPIAYLIICK